jgi:hypothetical protein
MLHSSTEPRFCPARPNIVHPLLVLNSFLDLLSKSTPEDPFRIWPLTRLLFDYDGTVARNAK